MCNAYDIGGRVGSFPSALKARALRELEVFTERRLIRRTDQAPVLLASGDLTMMGWGFRRPGLGVVNNSRSDKLGGAMWRDSFRERRCLIPLSGYFEWTGAKGSKQSYRFVRPGGGGLWVAGIWEESSEFGLCFSMITTTANALVEPIHHRMPAVLEEDEWGPYLAGKKDTFIPQESSLVYGKCRNPLLKNRSNETQGELF